VAAQEERAAAGAWNLFAQTNSGRRFRHRQVSRKRRFQSWAISCWSGAGAFACQLFATPNPSRDRPEAVKQSESAGEPPAPPNRCFVFKGEADGFVCLARLRRFSHIFCGSDRPVPGFVQPEKPYTARALLRAALFSDRAGLRSANAFRRFTWSLTETRNIGWRAFFQQIDDPVRRLFQVDRLAVGEQMNVGRRRQRIGQPLSHILLKKPQHAAIFCSEKPFAPQGRITEISTTSRSYRRACGRLAAVKPRGVRPTIAVAVA